MGPAELAASPGRLGYRAELDGLRGVAIALVVWHHLGSMSILPPRALTLVPGGFLGVDLFFVLSGFLITTLLLERVVDDRGVAVGCFYARRARRLLPALVAYLVAHLVVTRLRGGDLAVDARTALAALTYTSNLAPTVDWRLAGDQLHLWSLAVEEQFYLLWPLAVLAGLRVARARRWLPAALLVATIAAIAVWRAVLTARWGSGYPVVYQRPDARFDALLVGALLAVGLRATASVHPSVARWLGVAGAAVLAVFVAAGDPVDGVLYRGGGYTLVAIAGAAVIVAALHGAGSLARALRWRPLVALGAISYSLYLWHVLAFGLVAGARVEPVLPRTAAALGLAIGFAIASHRLVELPFLRWRPAVSTGGTRERLRPRTLGLARVVWRPLAIGVAGTTVVAGAVAALERTPDTPAEIAGADTVPASATGDPDPTGAAPTGGPARGDAGAQAQAQADPPSDTTASPTTSAPPPAVTAPATGALRLLLSPPERTGPELDATLRLSATVLDASGVAAADQVVAFAVLVLDRPLRCEAVTDATGVATCTLASPLPLADLDAVSVTATTGAVMASWPA